MEKEIQKQIEKFVSLYKRFIIATSDYDFYNYFYLSTFEDFSDDVPIIAMSYKNLTTFGLPTILYGSRLLDYIEMVLKENPEFVKDFVETRKKYTKVSSENIYLVKQFAVFKEFIKHEIVHYLNLHLPRTIEFLNNHQLPLNEYFLTASNILADSIANRYVSPELVEIIGGVPALEKEEALEELLKRLLNKQGKGQGSDNQVSGNQVSDNQGSGGQGSDENYNGDLSDFTMEEAEDLQRRGKECIDRMKEILSNIVDRITASIGRLPADLEETVKYLRKKRLRFKVENGQDLFNVLREIERTYISYNPLNQNHYNFVFPSYTPKKGNRVALVVDTSGSMTSEQFQYVFSVLESLIKQSEIYLVEIDAQIQNVSKVSKFSEELTFKGRGGTVFTDLERLPQLLPKGVSAILILTDGYIYEFPSVNPYPTAKWLGLTTDEIPGNSPDWIRWFKVSEIEKEG